MTNHGPEGYDPFDTSNSAGSPGAGPRPNPPGAPGFDRQSGAPAGARADGYQAGGYRDSAYPGPGYQGDHQGTQPGYGAAPNVSTGRGMAIAALVLGVLALLTAAFFIGGLLAIVAIILAIVALRAGAKARKLGSTDTAPTTAMSIIGIVAAVAGLALFAFVLFITVATVDVSMECRHLEGDPEAFGACVEGALLDRFGVN